MTNQERIQNYSTEDLAEWMMDLMDEGERNMTKEEWIEFLKEESDEEEDYIDYLEI